MSDAKKITDKIAELCDKFDMSFPRLICEALYIYDPDLEELGNEDVQSMLEDFEAKMERENDRL